MLIPDTQTPPAASECGSRYDMYHTRCDIRALTLTNSDVLVALVDGADYERVKGYYWFGAPGRMRKDGTRNWWAYASIGNSKSVALHRLLMDPPAGMEVDHKNRNGLDNRRSNMRLATKGQNNANVPGRSRTGFKGVYKVARCRTTPFKAVCQGKTIGWFATAEAAAMAYNDAAMSAFGEFAVLNVADGSTSLVGVISSIQGV